MDDVAKAQSSPSTIKASATSATATATIKPGGVLEVKTDDSQKKFTGKDAPDTSAGGDGTINGGESLYKDTTAYKFNPGHGDNDDTIEFMKGGTTLGTWTGRMTLNGFSGAGSWK